MQTSTCRHPASPNLAVRYFQAERGWQPLPLLSDRHSAWVEEAKLKPAEVDFLVFLDNCCKGEKGAVCALQLTSGAIATHPVMRYRYNLSRKLNAAAESETEQCRVLKKVISPRDPVVSHFPCGKHKEVGQHFPEASKVNLDKVQSQFINQSFNECLARGRHTFRLPAVSTKYHSVPFCFSLWALSAPSLPGHWASPNPC